MARTFRTSSLETRTARLRLKVRPKPYWIPSGKQGVQLGYRRLARGNGTWSVKLYVGRDDALGGKYEVKSLEAQADDYAEADGSKVLTYFQAIEAALKHSGGDQTQAQRDRRYTVADAVEDYVTHLTLHKKTSADAQSKLRAYFLPYFKNRLLADLRPQDFEGWLAWALTHKPKGRRTGKLPKAPRTEKQIAAAKLKAAKPVATDEEKRRRKKNTLNRVINNLKACLNHAFEGGKVETDAAWRKLKRFGGVDSARVRWLSAPEAARLINAAAEDFRPILHAAMLTGARWTELRKLEVADFDARSGTLLIRESKSGKARRVPLNDDGKAAFTSWTAGRPGSDIIFKNRYGNPWGEQDQKRPIDAASAAAKIDPAVSFHVLRHSYASQLVQAGVSLFVVAAALGHRDTRMVEKHYGHLAPSHIAAEIRGKLPALGVPIGRKVVELHQ